MSIILFEYKAPHTYVVTKTGYLSWTIERDDGEEYFVNYLIFKEKFSCTCQGNVFGYDCKHIRMVKEHIVKEDKIMKEVIKCQ